MGRPRGGAGPMSWVVSSSGLGRVGWCGSRWCQRQPMPRASHTRPWSKAQIQSVRWLSGQGHSLNNSWSRGRSRPMPFDGKRDQQQKQMFDHDKLVALSIRLSHRFRGGARRVGRISANRLLGTLQRRLVQRGGSVPRMADSPDLPAATRPDHGWGQLHGRLLEKPSHGRRRDQRLHRVGDAGRTIGRRDRVDHLCVAFEMLGE
jgi:hypothetical protein